jgi:hypothetical protein
MRLYKYTLFLRKIQIESVLFVLELVDFLLYSLIYAKSLENKI